MVHPARHGRISGGEFPGRAAIAFAVVLLSAVFAVIAAVGAVRS
jgi:hypothetical protein